MKKIIYTFCLLAVSTIASANVKTNFYSSVEGLTGYELKSALKKVLEANHINRGYGALFKVYMTSDRDETFENDGSIVDIYSEDPKGEDPFNFKTFSQKCGSYKNESDCFNREHIFPQGTFRKRAPMKSDFFHIYPTDGYVNGKRGSLPFGEVAVADWQSANGSKRGRNTTPGYSGKVFEPIDEFKGDIARALLYFATRYEDRVSGWRHAMLDGSRDQVYAKWFITLLVKWHNQDPISKHEIKRNEAGYQFQGNRNPFIDHPEWVGKIWSKY